jgi:hypothetical protein
VRPALLRHGDLSLADAGLTRLGVLERTGDPRAVLAKPADWTVAD